VKNKASKEEKWFWWTLSLIWCEGGCGWCILEVINARAL